MVCYKDKQEDKRKVFRLSRVEFVKEDSRFLRYAGYIMC